MITKRYLPDGSTRAIWDDAVGGRERHQGVIPQRASRIEVIPDGPKRGLFHVDFTLLAEAVQDDSYRVCLVQTFENYGDANKAEVEWLRKNWVLTASTPARSATISGSTPVAS